MIKKKGIEILVAGLLITSLFGTPLFAQNAPAAKNHDKKEKQQLKKERINQMIKHAEEGALIYQKQNIYGIKLYSDGWSGFYEKSIMKTVDKTTLFSLEIGERKHAKEEKITKSDGTGFFLSKPLIYGKQNNFYFMKLGVGQSFLIGGKGNRNGVAVSAVYGAGLSLGFLKPYFVDVIDPVSRKQSTIQWMGNKSRNDTLFLDANALEGGSGMLKGFSELKFKPGLHAKGAVRFDYSRYNEVVSAIETGINVEYYVSDMPIMLLNKERKLFANVFIALEFGRRK